MLQVMTAALLAAFLTPGAAQTREQRDALKHYRSGQQALATERYQEAVDEFQSAVRLDPLLVPAHYGLGQAHMALKEYPEALRAYTRCEQAFHESEAVALTDRVAADRRLDEYIKALEDDLQYLQRVAQGTNLNAQRAEQASTTKEQQINALKARRLRTAGAPEPTPGWLSLALGSAHFRLSDLAQAEEHYKKAIAVSPELGEAHNNLAVVYLLTGRPTEAAAEIQAAEKTGFKVNPQLKKDVAARAGSGR
jgi:tetratricopeptide (TPR) repeat protein